MKASSHNSETVKITNRHLSSAPSNRFALPGSLVPASDAESRAMEVLRTSHKLIEMGRLSASIAHEINNPLSSISNLLFLLRQVENLPPEALGYLDLIEHEMDRVISISKQSLNFSRESSRPDHIQMAELMDEVLYLYRRRIEEKQLVIRRSYLPAGHVWGLPGELRQVLSNLVINAIDASSQGGALQVRVRKATSFQGDAGVRVTIADSGTGIPPEALHRLGEPFFSTKGQQGTGLGLWVIKTIVERHAGELRLRSRWGGRRHGTVFTLFLPLTAPVAGAAGPGPVLVPSSSRSRSLTAHPDPARESEQMQRRVSGR